MLAVYILLVNIYIEVPFSILRECEQAETEVTRALKKIILWKLHFTISRDCHCECHGGRNFTFI